MVGPPAPAGRLEGVLGAASSPCFTAAFLSTSGTPVDDDRARPVLTDGERNGLALPASCPVSPGPRGVPSDGEARDAGVFRGVTGSVVASAMGRPRDDDEDSSGGGRGGADEVRNGFDDASTTASPGDLCRRAAASAGWREE